MASQTMEQDGREKDTRTSMTAKTSLSPSYCFTIPSWIQAFIQPSYVFSLFTSRCIIIDSLV